MPTKFFTNSDDNSLLKKFEGTLKHITKLNHLMPWLDILGLLGGLIKINKLQEYY